MKLRRVLSVRLLILRMQGKSRGRSSAVPYTIFIKNVRSRRTKVDVVLQSIENVTARRITKYPRKNWKSVRGQQTNASLDERPIGAAH